MAPEQPRLLIVLASEMLRLGRLTEAAEYLRVFLRVEPEDAMGYLTLAQVRRAQGATRLALEQYQRVDELQPDRPGVLNEMAWLRAVTPDAGLRDPAAAVRLATRAALLTDRTDPNILDTLAAALAAAGRFDDAERTAGEAIGLARRGNDESLAADIAQRLAGYQLGRPFLEPPPLAPQTR
jgi:spermidine synthase